MSFIKNPFLELLETPGGGGGGGGSVTEITKQRYNLD